MLVSGSVHAVRSTSGLYGAIILIEVFISKYVVLQLHYSILTVKRK
jgi:hypothetical protein